MYSALVVSDVRLYRQGLADMLTRDGRLEIRGKAASGPEAFELAGSLQPAVILLDMALPDGLATIRALSSFSPAAKVIALGVTESRSDILACAEAGVAGYVCRQSSLEDLVETVESALRGELNCSPRIAGTLFRHVGRLSAGNAEASGRPYLTPRETELCQLLSEGLTNQEIASRLNIQLSTVKAHVHNILEKVGAHHRGEAVAKLRRLGQLLPPRAASPAPAPPSPPGAGPAQRIIGTSPPRGS